MSGDDAGESAQIAPASMDAYEDEVRHNDLLIEIDTYKRELAEWGITMDALAAHSPKHAHLKSLCREIIDAAADDDEIMRTMWIKHYFPAKKSKRQSAIAG